MRILLCADIHANLPALQAVLAASADMGCEELWCLGDIVGYGPFPNETALLMQQKAARIIAGNHDVKVVSSREIQRIIDQNKEAYKVFVFTWTHRTLTPSVTDYLRELPCEDRVVCEGQRILMVHGSPRGIADGLTVHTPSAKLEELAREADADVLLVGHTHEPFVRHAGTALVINPGSVGRPFDGDTRASFMVLDISSQGIVVREHRVAYDMKAVADEMRCQAFPDVLVRAFLEARSPAEVLPEGVAGDLIDAVISFGEKYHYEKPHAFHVAALAMKIFEALDGQDGIVMGASARRLVQAGALLHDIGIVRGASAHHKASRDMVLAEKTLPVTDRERMLIALIARYHRRSLPKDTHAHYAYLPDLHRVLLGRLAGIVRLADGLDRSHRGLVNDIKVEVKNDEVRLGVVSDGNVDAEIEFGLVKRDLLSLALGKKITITKVA